MFGRSQKKKRVIRKVKKGTVTAKKLSGAHAPKEDPGKLSKSDRNSILLALFALGPLFYVLLIYRPGGSPSGSAIGRLESETAVRRRHARSLYWTDLRGQEAIFLRDIVYTPKGVRAVFVLGKNQRIEIEPDSMVQFDEVTLDSINITLFGGSVRGTGINLNALDPLKLKPYQAGKLLPFLPDLEPFELRMSELDSRILKKVRSRPRLKKIRDILQPELKLNSMDHFYVELVSPEQDQLFPLKRDQWVKMTWSPVPIEGAVYEVSISKSRAFTQAVVYESDDNFIEGYFEEESSYYWQVSVYLGKSVGRSEVGRFVLSRKGLPLFSRLPTQTKLEGNVHELARDADYKKIVSSTLANGKKCSRTGLRPGSYWCRVLTPDRSKVLNEYRIRIR